MGITASLASNSRVTQPSSGCIGFARSNGGDVDELGDGA